MNKRGNYNNTPTERGCCHQPEPVLFSSPEKIRTGNENGNIIIADLANKFPLNGNKHAPTTRGTLAKTTISFKAEYHKLKRMQNFFY